MDMGIARHLAQLRRERGYSQESLAAALGVSRQAVSKWECAESSPDTENLIALARLYGVSLDELVMGVSGAVEDRARSAEDEVRAAEAPQPKNARQPVLSPSPHKSAMRSRHHRALVDGLIGLAAVLVPVGAVIVISMFSLEWGMVAALLLIAAVVGLVLRSALSSARESAGSTWNELLGAVRGDGVSTER